MFKLAVSAVLVALATGTAAANLKLSTKIVNGQDAKLGEFPHQVSLRQVVDIIWSEHFCGGSIILPSTILTAGHCVFNVTLQKENIAVWAGFIKQTDPGPTLQRRTVIDIIVHPGFAGGIGPNDLAILIVDSPFEITEYVAPIPLPKEDNEVEGIATVSGWGSNSTSAIAYYPDILQKSHLLVVPYDLCRVDVGNVIDQTMICTGPLTGGHGTCSGDSGGPLIHKGTLVGVVSWGFIPCASFGLPAVFTKVSSHLQWINDNMSQNNQSTEASYKYER